MSDLIVSVDPLGAAQARAVNDSAFAELLRQAGKAGAVVGSATNMGKAGEFFRALGDEIAKPAMVILGIRAADDGQDGAAELPAMDAAPGLLLEYCGLVNQAIAEAQKAARLAAVRKLKAADMQKSAKNARNAVVERMRRHLANYGLLVNFAAGTCEAVDTPDVKTDAEKAAERILSAFKLDVRGALDGLASLEPQAWAYVVARVSRLEAERQAESAAEQARGLREAADMIAERVKSMVGKADMVSLANAEREAAEADKHAKEAAKRAANLESQLKAA